MTYEFWNTIGDRKTAHERILTGHRDDEVLPFDNSLPKMAEEFKPKKILDFGCGVGRNTYGYVTLYPEIHVYDFPNMTDMLKSDERYDKFKDKITIHNNWEEVKKNKYDVVFASLVFQHINESDLNNYLKDLAGITKKLVIFTRGYIDGSRKDIFPILERHFDIQGEYIEDRTSNSSASSEMHYRAVMTPKRIE